MSDFTEQQLDRLFFALSDQTRRRMLRQLSQADANVSELGQPLGLSKQLVSKHIKVLEEAGFVQKTKDGRIQRCHLNQPAMNAVAGTIEQYREFWSNQLDALEAFIQSTKQEKNK